MKISLSDIQQNSFNDMFTDMCKDNGILFVRLNPVHYKYPQKKEGQPLFKLILVYIVVEKGTIGLNLDSRWIHCKWNHNNLIEIHPYISVYDLQMSPDFSGYLIALEKLFIDDNMPLVQFNLPHDVPLFAKKSGCTLLPDEHKLILDKCRKVGRNFTRIDHRYQHQIIKLTTLELYAEMLNFIYEKRQVSPENEKASRKEDICRNFVTLLSENVKKEHHVSFYADRLCITRQYLNRVIKEAYNLPASNMIANVVISKAISLLHQPNITVQEVAEILNYPDLATFSKFFKRHVGQSPIIYRKQNK